MIFGGFPNLPCRAPPGKGGDGCLKDGLAGGDVGQAAVDPQGDVLDDQQRVVAVHMIVVGCA